MTKEIFNEDGIDRTAGGRCHKALDGSTLLKSRFDKVNTGEEQA